MMYTYCSVGGENHLELPAVHLKWKLGLISAHCNLKSSSWNIFSKWPREKERRNFSRSSTITARAVNSSREKRVPSSMIRHNAGKSKRRVIEYVMFIIWEQQQSKLFFFRAVRFPADSSICYVFPLTAGAHFALKFILRLFSVTHLIRAGR